jgi:phage-related protein
MPISISTNSLREKNKLTSDGKYVLLLEVIYDSESVYLCWNSENVTWNNVTWLATAFELGDLNETKESELPSVDLSVYDIYRTLMAELPNYAGGIGATVVIRVINTNTLFETTPLCEENFDVMEVSVDSGYKITLKLGAENLSNYRSPSDRFLKSHCRYGTHHGGFKGPYCGYTGAETSCNRTFTRCQELLNTAKFGGFPGVGTGGIFK